MSKTIKHCILGYFYWANFNSFARLHQHKNKLLAVISVPDTTPGILSNSQMYFNSSYLPFGWNILETNLTVGGLLGYSSVNSIVNLKVPSSKGVSWGLKGKSKSPLFLLIQICFFPSQYAVIQTKKINKHLFALQCERPHKNCGHSGKPCPFWHGLTICLFARIETCRWVTIGANVTGVGN